MVSPQERTGAFGKLSGYAMLGTSLGYTLGGLTGDRYSTAAPFKVTLCLLLSSTVFAAFFLPYLPPTEGKKEGEGKKGESFLNPLRVLLPKTRDGKRGKDWNVTTLGAGAFFSVFATGFVPMMLQYVFSFV